MEEFLIAEYNALQARALEFEKAKSSRINFLLLVLGGTIAGFSGLLEFKATVVLANYNWLLIVLILINLCIGILTLKFSVDQTVAIIAFHRRAGRIRNYFYQKDLGNLSFFAFPPTDEKPRYYIGKNMMMWRGAEPIPLLLNALFAGLLIFISLNQASLFWRLSLSIGFFISVLFTQINLISSFLRYQDKNDPVFFPKSSFQNLNKKKHPPKSQRDKI